MATRKEPQKQKPGRPTLYDPKKFPDRAFKLALLGLTNEQLATAFGVAVSTISLWMVEHKPFSDAITRGRDEADGEIAHSLYHRAKGYSHKAVKMFQAGGQILREEYTEHYPPDTMAASLWLRNRRGDKWRNQPAEGEDNPPPAKVPVQVVDASTPDPGV